MPAGFSVRGEPPVGTSQNLSCETNTQKKLYVLLYRCECVTGRGAKPPYQVSKVCVHRPPPRGGSVGIHLWLEAYTKCSKSMLTTYIIFGSRKKMEHFSHLQTTLLKIPLFVGCQRIWRDNVNVPSKAFEGLVVFQILL